MHMQMHVRFFHLDKQADLAFSICNMAAILFSPRILVVCVVSREPAEARQPPKCDNRVACQVAAETHFRRLPHGLSCISLISLISFISCLSVAA